MSPKRWYRQKRVARVDRIVEMRDILHRLAGTHPPERQTKSTVWRFAITLGLMAAVYSPLIIQDLSEGYTINWSLVALLSLCIFAAVALLFFMLSTHNHTYTFEDSNIKCVDSRGDTRWDIHPRDIEAIEIHRLRGQRFYAYLITSETQKRLPIHCHPSISDKIAESPVIQLAFQS